MCSLQLQDMMGFSHKKPARKRENLDHLSEKERITRRKITNRVSAQAARERKKAQVVALQALLDQLKKDNDGLKSSYVDLELELKRERTANAHLRSAAAQTTSASQCNMSSTRGCQAAPGPVFEDEESEATMNSQDINDKLVGCESAALDVSQPQKRCTSPTTSVMLLMACLSCLASPTSAQQSVETSLTCRQFSLESPVTSTSIPTCPLSGQDPEDSTPSVTSPLMNFSLGTAAHCLVLVLHCLVSSTPARYSLVHGKTPSIPCWHIFRTDLARRPVLQEGLHPMHLVHPVS